MPVNISIKNVPDHIAKQLRRRAARNHRSLQGELMAILEESVARDHQLSPREFLDMVKNSGLQTPDEATYFLREDRDAR